MRNTVQAKRPKQTENLSIIILHGGIGRRMKSYGPKALIQLANEQTVLSRQINILNDKFPNAEIIIVTGFGSDKVIKQFGNVKTVENHLFEETSALYSAGLGMRVASYSNTLILYGSMVFDEQVMNFDIYNDSLIITGPMKEDTVGVNIDEKNNICYFDYGLTTKWSQIVYLSAPSSNLLKFYAVNKDYCKLHIFEILNKMIDAGHIFKNIKRSGDLIDIENVQDIEKAIRISKK